MPWIPALACALALLAASSTPAEAALQVTRSQAVAAVRAVLKQHARACGYRVTSVVARASGRTWRVTATVKGDVAGAPVWVVGGKRPKAASRLARTIEAGCPKPPPPPPLPPPGPPAPASYTYGSEVSAAQQAEVRRAFDAAARSYRTVLARELPPLFVWVYADVEAMIAAYAQTKPASPEDARAFWQAGQVGHAIVRKVWLGPGWFAQPAFGQRMKIAAHEAFHVLQYDLTPESIWFGGIDDVRAVGPWWLLEGTAEYFGALAVVEDGGLTRGTVESQWVDGAKQSPTLLRNLETFRGQTTTSRPYDIYALAVQRLVLDRDPKSVLGYFEAVGRGIPWRDAFASSFGRSVGTFYDEFEAYRRTL